MVYGIIKEVDTMVLTEEEIQVLHETRKRNQLRYLKRLYSKLKEHPELVDLTIDLKEEIDELESAMT
jgi:hypothetical protein